MAGAFDGPIPFGLWLKQQRHNRDLTQEELAQCVGCSEITIQKIESGERRPSKQVALRLAECLQIPESEQDRFVSFARAERKGPYSGAISDKPAREGALLDPPLPVIDSGPMGTTRRDAALTNLRVPLTPLIGRERILADSRGYLLSDGVRLLMFTGAPGIGKTRLAIEVALDLLGTFRDGVWFIELAPIVKPDLVAGTIATILGVKEAGSQTLLEGLVQFLKNKRALLVLDNFEQVLDASPVVVDLLGACPFLKVLVTSREALHLPGEQQLYIPPLETPGLSGLAYLSGLGRGLEPDALSAYSAMTLFVQRARSVDPNFQLTEENAETVAAICSRLDGLPLAIELAAARTNLLPPREMLARLGSRFKLLTTGTRHLHHLPARQQTLRSAIDWSYALLDQEESKVFRRLAVFAGGCTFDAIEAVAAPGAGSRASGARLEDQEICSALGIDILDGVQSLIDKNLLRQREGVGGEPRFVMLETIHEYTREKLQESGEAEMLRRKHAHYFLRLAEEAEPKLRGPEQADWLQRLAEDQDNFRAALEWAASTGGDAERAERAELGLRLAAALGWSWFILGLASEGRQRLVTAISAAKASMKGVARTQRAEGAEQRVRVAYARALGAAGILAWLQADFASARAFDEEALHRARELGDKSLVALLLNSLGCIERDTGDLMSARALFEESLRIEQELGDKSGIAALINLAEINILSGRYGPARLQLEEALLAANAAGDQFTSAVSLQHLGCLAYFEGDYTSARSLSEASLTMQRELDNRWYMVWPLRILGLIALRQHDYDEATTLLEQALALSKDLGSKHDLAWCLAAVAAVAGARGQPQRAARLFAASDALCEAIGNTLAPVHRAEVNRDIAAARAQVDEAAWESAWYHGRTMGLEQAVANALEKDQVKNVTSGKERGSST